MSNEHSDTAYTQIDLFDLLHGMIKSAMHLLVPGIAMVVLMIGLLCFRAWHGYSPRYQASASFTVKVVNPLYSGVQSYNNAAADQMAKTFPHILTSGILSERVKEEMKISYMPPVSASVMGSTNIFTLSVSSSDPQLAYDVLNCVMEVYPSVAEFVIGPTQMTLMSETGVPESPVNSLSLKRTAVKGAAFGVILWGALSFLYWFMHKTVNNEEELKRIINLPCMSRIPRVPGRKTVCPLLDDGNDKFGFNESIRLLRVRVEKALEKEGGKVLMVTSTIPNEGKTTVSVNLAIALAQKGKRTMLVDCDLRNPSISGILNLEVEHGFSEFLQGKCSLNDVFYRMEYENLYGVFGAKGIGNPEKLLADKKASAFIDATRRKFDYIILDTPPCAMMADASDILTLADGVLLTVRQDFAATQQIREGVQMLDDCSKPIIGTVLNMTTPKFGKSNYYSYYGYGYGYYGSKHSQQEEEVKE